MVFLVPSIQPRFIRKGLVLARYSNVTAFAGNLKIHLHAFVITRLFFFFSLRIRLKKYYRTISCLRMKCQRPNTVELPARNTGMEVSEFLWRDDMTD